VSFSDGIVQLTLKYQHYSCSEFSQGRDNTVPTQWQLTAHATTWLLVTQFYTVLPVSWGATELSSWEVEGGEWTALLVLLTNNSVIRGWMQYCSVGVKC